MKILFYSPYLNILGGGEHHLLQFASCLSQDNQVYLVWPDPQIVNQARARFDLDLSNFTVIPYLPPRFHLQEFGLLFFVSDGSIPFLPLGKSIFFFMSPFRHVHGRSLVNQTKLKFINLVICNPRYSKKFIVHEFNVNSQVVYPAVELPKAISGPKQNIILSVGRFSRTLHDKNQLTLVKAFINLESKLPDWKLVLVGGTESGSSSLVSQVRRQARGHRIDIQTDVSPLKLHQLYTQARLYWHAAGYGVDLEAHPQKAEHFGISVVEAMSYAAVPLVFNAGGPTEIVTPKSGITWDTLGELEQQTLKLIGQPQLLSAYSHSARHRAEFFKSDNLCRKLHEVLHL